MSVLLPASAWAGWTSTSPASVSLAYTSIVLDSSARPHIAYQDLTSNATVKIADFWGSSWTITDTGSVMTANNQGYGNALAIDASNNIYETNMQSSPTRMHLLKRTGLTWSKITGTAAPGTGNSETCVATYGPNVHLAYFDVGLKYYKSTNGSTLGSQLTIDAGASAGHYCSIKSTGSAGAHVSYYDSAAGDLKYAFLNATGTFTASTIDSAGNVGNYSSLALDVSSAPHISYYDTTNGNLKHAYKNSTGTWNIETVDSSTGDVGQFSAIAIPPGSTNPQIAYYDLTNTQLKWAKFNGATWNIEVADTGSGQHLSLAVDNSSNPHISYLVGSSGLRYTTRTPAAACSALASVASGNWSSPGTWTDGILPTSCSPVTIAAAHTVTVDNTSAVASTTTVNGTLSFSRSANSALAVNGGDLTVANLGILDLGTEASQIPSTVTATLYLATNSATSKYGLVVNAGGNFSARGSARSPFGYAVASMANGASTFDVKAASAAGWAVGDVLVIGPTSGQGVSRVDQRTITVIGTGDPLTVTLNSGVSSARTATSETPIPLANLTRNVVIRSSSAATAANFAYVRSLAQHTTGFYAAYAEFAYLGTTPGGKSGVTLDGPSAVGTISSSTFHDGYRGLSLSSAVATIQGSFLYKNSDVGLHVSSGGASGLSETFAAANGGAGFLLLDSPGNTMALVRSYANTGNGLLITGGSFSNTVSSSAFHSNSGHGIQINGALAEANFIENSNSYMNTGDGVRVTAAPGVTLSADYVFANLGSGVEYCGATSFNHYILGGGFGYDKNSGNNANGLGELRACAGGGGGIQAQANGANINPANGGVIATSLCEGDSIASYNENGILGKTKVHGDFKVKPAKPLKVNKSKSSNAPEYTGPNTVKGVSTISAITVKAAAVNELFKTTFDGTVWKVVGQKSGQVGTIAATGGTLDVAQLSFTLTSPSRKTGDRIHLVTHRASDDEGTKKTMKVGKACPAFNGGVGRFGVPAGATLEMIGEPGAATVIEPEDPADVFTFVSSGSFTMAHTSASKMDDNGLQLTGAGPVAISSAAFLDTGKGNSTTCTHLSLHSLAVAAELPGLHFGNGACANPKSIKISGDTSGLNITIKDPSGPQAGPDFVSDPDNKVFSLGGGPFVPGSPAFTTVGYTSMTVTWTSNSNNASVYYTVQASTASTFTGTIFSSVTFNLFGTISGLTAATTYYARVYSTNNEADSNYRNVGSTVTLTPLALFAPTSSTLKPVTTTTAGLTWNANGNSAAITYRLELSTASNFTGTITINNTALTTATISGLTPDTNYHLRVRSVSPDTSESAFDSTKSTTTLPAAPTAPAASPGLSSMTVTWGSGGNPGTTRYLVQISVDPGFSPILSSSSTALTTSSFTGLDPNTTYYMRVHAVGQHGDSVSADVSVPATATLALAPTASALRPVTGLTAGLSWTDGGNPGLVRYRVEASTASNFTGAVYSSTTLLTQADVAGLIGNTAYYLRVRAQNLGGVPTAFDGTLSTTTLTNAPFNSTLFQLSSVTLGLQWDATSNGPGTLYRLEVASDENFTTNLVSSETYKNTAFVTGLISDTTYYFHARASGVNNVSAYDVTRSTLTLLFPIADSALLPVTTGSVAMTWSANGNGAGTFFNVAVSSSPDFSAPVFSSRTVETTATIGGLLSDTTYYLHAQATGAGGRYSLFDVTLATATLPKAPSGSSAVPVTPTTAGLTWSANGNGPSSRYQVQASKFADFSLIAASSITRNTSESATGLTPNTDYFLRVRTLGIDYTTAFDATVATHTIPATPGTPVEGVVGLIQIQVTAAENNNPQGGLTTYEFEASTDTGFGVFNSSTAASVPNIFLQNLKPGTRYHIRVRARGSDGTVSPWSSSLASATDADQPTQSALTPVTATTAGLNWNSTGNGSETQFQMKLSTAQDFTGTVFSSHTLLTTATISGLTPNTTYHLHVRAVGPDGDITVYDTLHSTATLPNPPSVSALLQVSSVSAGASWSANGNPAGTTYRLVVSTAADFTGTQFSSRTVLTSARVSGLTPFVVYYLHVQAVGFSAYSAFDVTLSTRTDARPVAAPTSSALLPVTVTTSGLTWDPDGNDPESTQYEVQASTDSDFGATASSVTSNSSAYVPGLTPNTVYYLRVRTLGQNGNTAFDVTLATTTLANPPTGSALRSVGLRTVGLDFAAGGNPAGTTYRIIASTAANFSGIQFSSVTALTSADVAVAESNRAYYLKVQALNLEVTPTAYDSALSTTTLTAAPVSSTLVQLSSVTLGLTWDSNANILGTLYSLQIATDENFTTGLVSSQTVLTTASATGLSSDTTYYFHVKASGVDNDTAYDVTHATITLLFPPVSSALLPVTTGSVAMSWSANGNVGVSFRLQASALADFSGVVYSSVTLDTQATITDLVSDTTYYLRAQVLGGGGRYSLFDVTLATATLPKPPTGSVATTVSATTAGVDWEANGNGGSTSYEVQYDPTAGFPSPTSVLTPGTDYDAVSLTPNTSYFFRVRTRGIDLTTGFDVTVQTVTLPATPLNLAVSSVGAPTISVSFGANGNPVGGTLYSVEASRLGDFTDSISSRTVLTSATVSGLEAGVSYTLRARAIGFSGSVSDFTATVTTSTVIARPRSSALTPVSVTTAGMTWNGGDNPGGTLYIVEAATSSDFAGTLSSSQTVLTTATVSGLTPNTGYALRVKAVGSAYDATLTTTTLPNAPASSAATVVTASKAGVSFSANGNPSGTLYGVEISTASDFAVLAGSVQLTALTKDFSGLLPDTNYHLRVRSNGLAGDSAYDAGVATATLPAPPVSAAVSAAGETSVSLNFGTNGNPERTRYLVQASTASDFSGQIASSDTASTAVQLSGLARKTSYYLRVRSYSPNGSMSSFISAGSTATAAALPLDARLTVVTAVAATMAWGDAGNPPDTLYEMQASVDTGFTGLAGSSQTTLTTATVSGLTPNTTYSLRLGVAGAYGVTLTTVTRANPPVSFGSASLFATSATFQWNGNGNPAGTLFRLQVSKDSGFPGAPVAPAALPAVILATTTASSQEFTGLDPASTYYARVESLDMLGRTGGFATTVTVVTQQPTARPPVLGSISNKLLNSGVALPVTLSLSDPDGDPLTITLTVSSASTLGATVTSTSTIQLLAPATFYSVYPVPITVSATDGLFTASTTFSARVRPGPTIVPPYPLPPEQGAAGFNDDDTINISWRRSGSPFLMDGLPLKGWYEIYINNGDGGEPTNLYQTIPSDGREFYLVVTSTMPPCTDFRFLLRTVNPWGVPDQYPTYFTARNACGSISIAHAPIIQPTSGQRIWQSGGAMLVAQLTGTPVEKSRAVNVRMQYRTTASTITWTSLPDLAVQDALGFYRSFWNPPSTGTYEVRGLVTDVDAQTDELSANGIGVAVVASSSAVQSGTIVTPGQIQSIQHLVCGGPLTLYSESPAGNPEPTTAKTELDACAFSAASDIADIRLVETIRLRAPEDANIPSGKAPIGHNVQVEVIDFVAGVNLTDLDNGKYAYITMTYLDANDDGIIDGTETLESTLEMWHFHNGVWGRIPEGADLVWTRAAGGQAGRMRVRTNKFSQFRMMGIGVQSTLDLVGIFPNPFKPNDGRADNGVAYTGAANTGITFMYLPGTVNVKIYTVSGALVADITADNTSGRFQWNAKNKDGKDVASGGYLAVISSPGLGKAVKKLLIVR